MGGTPEPPPNTPTPEAALTICGCVPLCRSHHSPCPTRHETTSSWGAWGLAMSLVLLCGLVTPGGQPSASLERRWCHHSLALAIEGLSSSQPCFQATGFLVCHGARRAAARGPASFIGAAAWPLP